MSRPPAPASKPPVCGLATAASASNTPTHETMRVLLQCAGHPAHRTLYGFCFGPISVQSVGVEACEGEIAVTRGSRAEPTRLVLRVRKVTFGGEISDLANKNGLSWPWPSQGSRSFLLGGPGSCVFRTGYPLCQAAPLPPPRPQVQVAPPAPPTTFPTAQPWALLCLFFGFLGTTCFQVGSQNQVQGSPWHRTASVGPPPSPSSGQEGRGHPTQ